MNSDGVEPVPGELPGSGAVDAPGGYFVSVYVAGVLRGTAPCFDSSDVVEAVGHIMFTEHLDHCAARFEDANGSGGWMMIGEHGEDPELGDLPSKRPKRGR